VESHSLVTNYIAAAKSFLDTNVLLYSHDAGAGSKHAAARFLIRELMELQNCVVSTQVLQEFWVNARRMNRDLSLEQLRVWIEDFSTWQVVANTAESVLAALEIERKYRVSFWDALIVHAAQVSGAKILYSEDLNHGQWYGSVRVVNPFLPQ
jgi:predicted nucleic acid-binding protein